MVSTGIGTMTCIWDCYIDSYISQVNSSAAVLGVRDCYSAIVAGTGDFFSGSYMELL